MKTITTDNAADVCKGVSLLFEQLKEEHPDIYKDISSFHVRCVSHVIDLGIKEFMELSNEFIEKVRSSINSIRASIKRRDIFDSVKDGMKVKCEIPSLDCQTRWSSTFEIIKKSYAFRRVITATLRRIGGLDS